jgi:hypothetical protein
MNERRAKKIIQYVRTMTDLYDEDPNRIFEDFESRDGKKNEAIKKTYTSVGGQSFCTECRNMKLKDEVRDEYYCPVHDY